MEEQFDELLLAGINNDSDLQELFNICMKITEKHKLDKDLYNFFHKKLEFVSTEEIQNETSKGSAD